VGSGLSTAVLKIDAVIERLVESNVSVRFCGGFFPSAELKSA